MMQQYRRLRNLSLQLFGTC